MEQYLVFRFVDEYYGLNVNNIENIEKFMLIIRVFYIKEYVKGVINF